MEVNSKSVKCGNESKSREGSSGGGRDWKVKVEIIENKRWTSES